MNPGLVDACKKAIATKTRTHPRGHPAVKVEDMLAVIKKESSFNPVFLEGERQLKENLATAVWATGLRESEIRALITISPRVGYWKVPRELSGRLAKWRLEPEWYVKSMRLHFLNAFYWSSSWGLVQFMGFNICPDVTREDLPNIIQRFAADIPMQLLYCAGELEKLLKLSNYNRPLAFTRYNAGAGAQETWDAYKSYGLIVDGYRHQIARELNAVEENS